MKAGSCGGHTRGWSCFAAAFGREKRTIEI
jgi:hypothetical protein